MNVDWNPIILALIGLIGTIIVTLIPVAVTAFFNAQSARLEKLKTVVDNNQEIVRSIVTVIQQTMGAIANSQKYQIAVQRAEEVLNLPPDTLHDMIELAVAEAKLAWGYDWDALGTPTDTTPTVTPATDPDILPLA